MPKIWQEMKKNLVQLPFKNICRFIILDSTQKSDLICHYSLVVLWFILQFYHKKHCLKIISSNNIMIFFFNLIASNTRYTVMTPKINGVSRVITGHFPTTLKKFKISHWTNFNIFYNEILIRNIDFGSFFTSEKICKSTFQVKIPLSSDKIFFF